MTIQELLNTDIRKLGLSKRAVNVFSVLGQEYNKTTNKLEPVRNVTLLDLMNISYGEMLHFRNLGKRTVQEIMDTIESFIEKHINIFNQFSGHELRALGLKDNAFFYYFDHYKYDITAVQTTSATQTKIDIRKKEIDEYYAAIENIKKCIAEKEFEIAKLQKEQKTMEKSEIKK